MLTYRMPSYFWLTEPGAMCTSLGSASTVTMHKPRAMSIMKLWHTRGPQSLALAMLAFILTV